MVDLPWRKQNSHLNSSLVEIYIKEVTKVQNNGNFFTISLTPQTDNGKQETTLDFLTFTNLWDNSADNKLMILSLCDDIVLMFNRK